MLRPVFASTYRNIEIKSHFKIVATEMQKQKWEIYNSSIYEGYFLVIGALIFILGGGLVITAKFWMLGLPMLVIAIYNFYKRPLLIKVYEDNIICYFISGKRVYNYTEVKHAQICSTGKGDRGVELSFAYCRSCVMYYASLNECVYYLNFLNRKAVTIKKNKLWNSKIVGNSSEGYRLEEN